MHGLAVLEGAASNGKSVLFSYTSNLYTWYLVYKVYAFAALFMQHSHSTVIGRDKHAMHKFSCSRLEYLPRKTRQHALKVIKMIRRQSRADVQCTTTS